MKNSPQDKHEDEYCLKQGDWLPNVLSRDIETHPLWTLVVRSCLVDVDTTETVHLDITVSISMLSAVHLVDVDMSTIRRMSYGVECEESESAKSCEC